MTTRLTARSVNAELKRRGYAERLVQGRGYCYFVDGRADAWYSASVPVCYVDQLTLVRWIEELEALAAENATRW